MCNFLQQPKWTTFIEVSLQVFFSNSEVKIFFFKKRRTDDSFAWKALGYSMSLWNTMLVITNCWLPSCQRQGTSCIFPTPHNLKKTWEKRHEMRSPWTGGSRSGLAGGTALLFIHSSTEHTLWTKLARKEHTMNAAITSQTPNTQSNYRNHTLSSPGPLCPGYSSPAVQSCFSAAAWSHCWPLYSGATLGSSLTTSLNVYSFPSCCFQPSGF